MSNITTLSSLTTMFQTTNVICQSVHLTDELKIGLEYDNHRGLLNIFLKNTENHISLPSHIHIRSSQSKECELTLEKNEYLLNTSKLQQDFSDLENEIDDISYGEEDEPKICIEITNIYVYDLSDANENDLCQTLITSSTPPLLFSSSSSSSSLSSSSCFDDQTSDNDDGYSTHSLDDIEQQQQSPSKLIIPFVSYQHPYYPEEYVSSVRRLIEEVMWLSPFKKTIKHMMINHLFH